MSTNPLSPPSTLPAHTTVLERGWLSSNNILFTGPEGAALVDTGYCSHAAQTLALVRAALGGEPLRRILNTHLHSDHCGGNAALQQAWPEVRTAIAPGQAEHVRHWDAYALSYTPTGQECPEFHFDEVLMPGASVVLGGLPWQIHAAPGHDPHSVVLFEPQSRTLISADALWETGFGVVFPELEGVRAFEEVAATLDLIERLAPVLVIPGHGALFGDAPRALATARRRLDGFVRHPEKHALYASKVLIKYKLLEWQTIDVDTLEAWVLATPYFELLHSRYFSDETRNAWLQRLIADLLRSGAARQEGDRLVNL